MSGELLVFGVAGHQYALPLERTREVLPRAALNPLPEPPPGVLGLLRLRGELLPVMDLRQRLGFPPAVPHIDHRIVVVDVGRLNIGLIVDGVDGLVTADALGEPSVESGHIIRGVVSMSGRVVTILDAQAVVRGDLMDFFAAITGDGSVCLEGDAHGAQEHLGRW